MKHRSRELSIFSMSALDLFASGMGAFILLAIMALPFFPNTGSAPEPMPEPEPIEDTGALKDAIEIAERERDEALRRAEQLTEDLRETIEELFRTSQERNLAQQQAASLQNQVAELEVPDLDLVICLDVSGSMSEQVNGLKQQISDLGRILNAVAPTGIGVVAFGDRYWERPLFVQNVTTNMSALENFINGLAPQMGLGRGSNNDSPEALAMGAGTGRLDELATRKQKPLHRDHVGLSSLPGAARRGIAHGGGFRRAGGPSHFRRHGQRQPHRKVHGAVYATPCERGQWRVRGRRGEDPSRQYTAGGLAAVEPSSPAD